MKPTATASRPRPVRRSRARAAAGALLVAAALAGAARAAPQGDPPSALEAAVRTHVAGALARDGRAPTGDALGRLEGRLGRGPYLLPFLAEHFEDPARGLAAMALAARLEGVDADALARAVASSGRRDRPFLERAASALAAACASGDLLARARNWCGDGAGPLRDAAVLAMPRSEEGCAAVASLLGCGDGRTAALAMEWLLTGPAAGLDRLLEALAVERLGPEARRAAMDGLLSARSALLPWIVPRIAADPQLVDLALTRPLPEGRRDEIVAELLAAPSFPSTDTWMSVLLGLGRPLGGRGLRGFALGRRAFEPVAARPARRAAPAGTGREELRPHLPSSGLRLDKAADIAAVLERALPVHAPFLAASADEPAERNFVRKHVLAYREEHGCDLESAALRVFSNATGAYGAHVSQLVESELWNDEDELAETWSRRKCFAYTRDGRSLKQSELLQSVLADVRLTYQSLDSVEVGVTPQRRSGALASERSPPAAPPSREGLPRTLGSPVSAHEGVRGTVRAN